MDNPTTVHPAKLSAHINLSCMRQIYRVRNLARSACMETIVITFAMIAILHAFPVLLIPPIAMNVIKL